MKKKSCLIVILIMVLFAGQALAKEIIPYASDEIHSATVSISTKKRVTYNVVVKDHDYIVHVNYCDLYKKTGTNTWKFMISMDDAIPEDTTGDMLVAEDISSYITEGGTYRVRVSYTVGNSTVFRNSNERTFD